MINRFLKTKFYIPELRTGAVSRPRLLAHLSAGLHEGSRLTLVSAPAGYGKTTLVAEWIHTIRDPCKPAASVAWLSLDEGENDPARFLSYLIFALQSLDGTLGQSLPGLLGMPKLPPLPAILDELINDLTALEQRIILFLDDYHVITNPDLHEALEYLIEHAPSSFHLAITTREDPPFSLARMRARRQMTEVRAHDLRFTSEEAQQFFNQSMNLKLDAGTIHALETRTEGWVVGLQLAALAMQNLPGQQDFLSDFNGSHRYVIDYLLDEVLKRQPPEISEFLLKTALLKRFNGELCQVVTGTPSAAAILSELERCNLFLIPLDSQRGWYRYHHLFADALSAGLSPEMERDIRLNAARWFESQGFLAEAIPYWLAIRETKEVERLIVILAVDLIRRGELQTLLGWLNSLPVDTLQANPDLLSYKALSLLMTGQMNQAHDCVMKASQGAESQERSTHSGRLLAIRAWFSSVGGETRTGELANAALAQLDGTDLFFRILALVALGDHHAWNANLPMSSEVFRQAYELGRQLEHPFITLAALVNLAFNLLDQGQLNEAEALCHSALSEYVDPRGEPLPIAGMIYSPLATICYEKGEFEEAQSFARAGSDLCQRLFSSAIMGKDNEIVLARIAFQGGDVKQAFDILQSTVDAARQSHMLMLVCKMKIVQAELYLAQGNLAQAESRLQELDALVTSNLIKVELVVDHLHAIHAAAAHQPRKALEILDRVEQANSKAGSLRRMIGVHITKALIHQQLSRHEQALSEFEAAIRLAAPEGYRAPFLPRQTRQTRPLLQASRAVAPAFVDSILALTLAAHEASRPVHAPLSTQEHRVLRLIVAGKSNQEIADELVISVGTAKWHVHNILQKLGVESRAEAIACAHELGIKQSPALQ